MTLSVCITQCISTKSRVFLLRRFPAQRRRAFPRILIFSAWIFSISNLDRDNRRSFLFSRRPRVKIGSDSAEKFASRCRKRERRAGNRREFSGAACWLPRQQPTATRNAILQIVTRPLVVSSAKRLDRCVALIGTRFAQNRATYGAVVICLYPRFVVVSSPSSDLESNSH